MSEKRPLIVQKYGGSSLATPDHIRRVARHIIERKDQNCDLVVVVSAMGNTTDNFVKLAHELNPNPNRREIDMLLSSGEQISIAALALAINAMGKYTAVSFTGFQVGIYTDDNHTQANILEIRRDRLLAALKKDYIVIVAGFQGISVDHEITTLGRGGSDTTAVAIAAVLDADYCEILSDIDGIYSADPKKVPAAKRIDRIHYDQALEMSSCGAKILHKKSIEYAKKYHLKLSLGSSLSGQIGTIVTGENIDKGSVTGVTVDEDVAVLRFSLNQSDAMKIPDDLSKNKIRLKIWQSVQGLGLIGISKGDANFVKRILQNHSLDVTSEENLVLLSIVGQSVGVGTQIAEQFFQILSRLNINYKAVVSGELSLKVLCSASRIKVALEEVHNALMNF